jgi:hypothetical protein
MTRCCASFKPPCDPRSPGVAVAKYADHLPLERQARMMAREGLQVESQTVWDQLNAIACHLEPTYEGDGSPSRHIEAHCLCN